MNTHKRNSVLMVAILVLLCSNAWLLLKPKTINNKPKVTILRDTVWQTKTDTFTLQTTRYEKVYIPKNVSSKTIYDTIFVKDSSAYISAKQYNDTLRTKDIDIYSSILVKGSLLSGNLSYTLKVPREIHTTKTVEQPKIYKSGLYLFSEIGGNQQQFNNLSLGLQYNQKGNWFASYRINLNTAQPTHNIGVGWRLFNKRR